ncbi:MAG: DPP IV N-terminal domain-containing protein [Ginsengibacter sp.]
MKHKLLFSLLFTTATFTLYAQFRDSLTAGDYARAEQYLYYHTAPLVDHPAVRPNWVTDDNFWFRDLAATGSNFIFVDAAKGSLTPAFDQAKLAASLSKATGKTYTADGLPFQYFKYSEDNKTIYFWADGKEWECDLQSYQCAPGHGKSVAPSRNRYQVNSQNSVTSPDGKLAAYIKDWNLWVRDIASGKETQLTTDGVENFGYATDNAGWRHSDLPVLLWSPDSKKIATYKQDQRQVTDMYLVSTNVGAPRLEKWKYEFPADTPQMKIYRVIINVPDAKIIFLTIPPDPRRSTNLDDILVDGKLADAEWSADAGKLAFVSTSRFHKTEKVRIANATTGDVSEIFQETVPTQFESGDGGINWRYLAASNEFIWFSQRDNWGHLYLYDGATGKMKNKITGGNYDVTEIIKVDEKARCIYFNAAGLEPENPYFLQLCKINFDGKGFKILTPEMGTHEIALSPSGKYFIDTYSKPDIPAVSVLRKLDGQIVATLAKTDVSRLRAKGWKPPVPFKVKAADGKTDIYGLMFSPVNYDPQKKYPVIDYIYPGPQGGSVGPWSFYPSRGDQQALAELGFVVVVIEGTSNPLRTKEFQDMSYGDMSVNTLPDQISGIRQLASRYSWIDTSRVGIWGHSGGGFATAGALLRYPDFFKVGIAESGNHDNRNYESDWGDRYNGPISNDAYAAGANQTYAKNLKGKLMLVAGLMDDNVPPQNTLLLVQALQDANKDFDLVIYPDSRHGYGKYAAYQMRLRWDYFVKNLLGKQPPPQYEFKQRPDPRNDFR